MQHYWSGPVDKAGPFLFVAGFEICRRNSFTPIGGGMGAGPYVDGEIHMAIIEPDGVSAAPIHIWADAIGRLIKVATVQ